MDKYIMDGKDVIEKYCLDYVNKFDPEHYDKCQTFLLECIQSNKTGIFNIDNLVGMDMCPSNYGIDCESLCENNIASLRSLEQYKQCKKCWKQALEKQV